MKNCNTQTIETMRLILRTFQETDSADMLKNWIADPGVQFEYGEPVYTSEVQVKELLQKWQ